jgi:lipopolysaccharide export system ATP-binding protein
VGCQAFPRLPPFGQRGRLRTVTQIPSTAVAGRDTLRAESLQWHHTGRWIVDGVSLTVGRGEIVGLLGPNGAGKTVTLSMIVGLLKPTSGHVWIGDADVTHRPLYVRARLGLGYLPQERSIFTKLTARDNILAILETRPISRRAARARADELLAQFGLEHVAGSLAVQLSGGEQRRLEIARSLASEPHFLLFDEPFAGIDPLTVESLHQALVALRLQGVGLLLTDHNVRETLSLCDRIYVLFDGRVLAEGSAPALVDNAEVRRHFLGESFEFDAASRGAANAPDARAAVGFASK